MAGKRLHDDLNLTAFVDLFSSLVCFLLLTAVWVQIESLSTNVDKVTSSDQASSAPDKKKVNLTVTILQDHTEMAEDERVVRIPNVSGFKLDMPRITTVLQDWKRRFPDRNDLILNTENTIPYKNMISAFDAMVGAGWPDVGVNTQ